MKGSIKSIFSTIKTVDDLQKNIPPNEDGEAPWLELKGVQADCKMQHQKSLIAKEISAFLNSQDGILAWGVTYDKNTKKISIQNNFSLSLEDFFNNNIKDMVQPVAKGILCRTISDTQGRQALLIFVPKSTFAPHRVWDGADKEYRRNYYARSGTNSVPLPESLVRSLYTSLGRTPNLSIYTEPSVCSSTKISLNVFAIPDESIYIDRYYDTEEFCLLDDNGKLIKLEEDGSCWTSLTYFGSQSNYPIYPASASFRLFSNDIIASNAPQNGTFMDELLEETACDITQTSFSLSPRDFYRIKYIFTKSRFACDNVQLVEDKRFFILSSSMAGINKYEYADTFRSSNKFVKIEDKYGVKIFASNFYKDTNIIDDMDDILTQPSYNQIRMQYLDFLLAQMNA